jgi:hypothetical protein
MPGGCHSSPVPIFWLYLINTGEQETVKVNEDKGEDKPGGCHSSQVLIFRLYLNLENHEKVQVNKDRGEDKSGGCHSSQVPIFRLYLIIRRSRRQSRLIRTRVKISQVGVALPWCRYFGCI